MSWRLRDEHPVKRWAAVDQHAAETVEHGASRGLHAVQSNTIVFGEDTHLLSVQDLQGP